MSLLSRRALVVGASAAGAALALPPTAHAGERAAGTAAEAAFSAFRLVRARPGEPGRPEITLPEGYAFVSGEHYHVASRAEYYTFVTGPRSDDGVEVSVRWPGVAVRAVIHGENRLRLRHDRADRDRFTFTLPVNGATAGADEGTIQIWSHPDLSPGMYWKIDHNDPDRVAGPWLDVPWPGNEARSQTHQLVAAHRVLVESGLKATAAAKGHRWFVAGFETNNTLHADNPPHWHITYNSGADFAFPTHNTHLWLDAEARNFYNGMDVTGLGRLKHYVGDPARIHDFVGDAHEGRGELVATLTIREDGGLDIAPPQGPVYAIAAGRDGSLIDEVTVLRDERPWLRVTTEDHYRVGLTTIRTTGLRHPSESSARVLRYDPLTGALL
ncbi:hypothetical protein [Streptomyces sp. SBT349]|uniref:hypothetical protein n=1 Tax=Streptomyces sp. SBT349 TaxID=1580539 RepID=UPI00066BC9EA|nr:hypothetical protein [Streptomyces sp. SBT349]